MPLVPTLDIAGGGGGGGMMSAAERKDLLSLSKRPGLQHHSAKTPTRARKKKGADYGQLKIAPTPGRTGRAIESEADMFNFFDGDGDLPGEQTHVDVFSSDSREAAKQAQGDAEAARELDRMAHHCLCEIDRFMQLKGIRTIDLFRRKDINKSSTSHAVTGGGDGDMTLDAEEFAGILKQTDMNFSDDEIQAVVTFLDVTCDGQLDVDEIDKALRKAKKRQRNIPRDAMSRIRLSGGSGAGAALKQQQLKAFLPKLLQRRYYSHDFADGANKATTQGPDWNAIKAAPVHLGAKVARPETAPS